jgi:hypothetical protein
MIVTRKHIETAREISSNLFRYLQSLEGKEYKEASYQCASSAKNIFIGSYDTKKFYKKLTLKEQKELLLSQAPEDLISIACEREDFPMEILKEVLRKQTELSYGALRLMKKINEEKVFQEILQGQGKAGISLRLALLQEITDQNFLFSFCFHEPLYLLQLNAVEKINNKELLEGIAALHPYESLREKAANKLKCSPRTLRK